ncbi:hypothetical protein ACGFS9_14370 [Streptomyces sp. NPDC048566]|uniref:hypothetical protein n=1 Tax=Streptomyces sp. NPDC048566 TaxID=3365569 RepID=UPI00371E6376
MRTKLLLDAVPRLTGAVLLGAAVSVAVGLPTDDLPAAPGERAAGPADAPGSPGTGSP